MLRLEGRPVTELQAVGNGVTYDYEQHGQTACANWQAIKINDSVQLDIHACRQLCDDAPACAAFNFNPTGCGAASPQQCNLYGAGCDMQTDGCWDYFAKGAATPADDVRALAAGPEAAVPPPDQVDEWMQTAGTGCSNWADIQIVKTVEQSSDECGDRCRATGGCIMFGFQPSLCSGGGESAELSCMLFRGTCVEEVSPCWVLYKPNPKRSPASAPAPARLATVAPDVGPAPPSTPNMGCVNWDKIMLSRGSSASAGACHAKCKSTVGCKHFGFSHSQECMLFRAECDLQPDDEWDFYQDSGAAPGETGATRSGEVASGAISGVGCSNWASIKIFNSLELTASKCREKCESHPHCLHFGFMPVKCGDNAAKECMLFGGDCQQSPDDCWDFYPNVEQASAGDQVFLDQPSELPAPSVVTAAAPVPVPAPSPAASLSPTDDNELPGIGCSNWEDIKISSNEGLNVDDCRASCRSTAGCVHFNYKPPQCGGLPSEMECMLFNGDCHQQSDECWNLYTNAGQPMDASQVVQSCRQPGTGCSNWADIEMGRETGITVDACHALCQSTPGCLSFNYNAAGCDDTPGQTCLMFSGDCNQQPDGCWDLYPQQTSSAGALAGAGLVGTGCSNWADIEIDRQSGLTTDACRSICQSTPGCINFNYKASVCGEGPKEDQVCLLFGGECDRKVDACWDLYLDGARAETAPLPAAVPAASAGAGGPENGTRCSNWADIEMDRHGGLTEDACRTRCQSMPGCVWFSFKGADCEGRSSAQECLLLKGQCATQPDECWGLYPAEDSRALEGPLPASSKAPVPAPQPVRTPTPLPALVPTPLAMSVPPPAPTSVPTSPPTVAHTSTPTAAPAPLPAPAPPAPTPAPTPLSTPLPTPAPTPPPTPEHVPELLALEVPTPARAPMPAPPPEASSAQTRAPAPSPTAGPAPRAAARVAPSPRSAGPAPRPPADPAPSWRERPSVGCSNWKTILLTRIKDSDEGSCRSACEQSDGCVSFGVAPAEHVCMIFGGRCQTQIDDQWTLWDKRPELPAAARENTSWTLRQDTGCKNWELLVMATTVEPTVDECRLRCREEPGCVSLNYKPSSCEREGKASRAKECVLFAGSCQKQNDSCWVLEESSLPAAQLQQAEAPQALEAALWTRHARTGCSNWKSMRMGEALVVSDWRDCRRLCLDKVGCSSFNVKPRKCGDDGKDAKDAKAKDADAKECVLLSGICESQEDECWDFYDLSEDGAWALEIPDVDEIALQAPPFELVVSSAAPLQCTELPAGNGTAAQRCQRGNGLGDGHAYVYNRHRGTQRASCGPGAQCECCRRDLTKVLPATSWRLQAAGLGCSNWYGIQAFETVNTGTADRCGQFCLAHQGCTGFNFQKDSVDRCNKVNGIGSGIERGACVMFFGECLEEPNPCFDSYQMVTEQSPEVTESGRRPGRALVVPWSRTGGVGCRNWNDIQIKETVTAASSDQCGALCKLQPGCTGFNFQVDENCTVGRVYRGACILFHSRCDFQANPCWDYFALPASQANSLDGLDGLDSVHSSPAHNASHASDRAREGGDKEGGVGAVGATGLTMATGAANITSGSNLTNHTARVTSTSENHTQPVAGVATPASVAGSQDAARATVIEDSAGLKMQPASAGDEVDAEVFGSMELEVQQPIDLVADAVVHAGIGLVVAGAVGVAQDRVSVALTQLPARRLMANATEVPSNAGSGNESFKGKVLAQYSVSVAGLHSAGKIVTALSSLQAEPATQMLDAILERAGHGELVRTYSAKITKIDFLGGTAGKDASGAPCSDFPLAWTDKNAMYACVDYVRHSWCSSSGGYGASWDPHWGSFADWGGDGVSAADACCGCGGGEGAASKDGMRLDSVVTDGLMGAGGGMVVVALLATVCCCCRGAPSPSGEAKHEAAEDLEVSADPVGLVPLPSATPDLPLTLTQ